MTDPSQTIRFETEETDDIHFVESLCWRMLSHGVGDRRSPMHLAVVGTARDGDAVMRTVVLRRVEQSDRRLFFHTDIRSAKISEIRDTGRLSWLFYDPALRSQVRLGGHTRIHHGDERCRAHWSVTRHSSKRCYLLPEGPGRPFEGPIRPMEERLSGFRYTEEESEAGFAHFVVVETQADWMEWYYTHGRGNRRAFFRYAGGALQEAVWRTP